MDGIKEPHPMDGSPVRIVFTVRTTWTWKSIIALRFALKGMLRRLGLKCERFDVFSQDETDGVE